MSEERSAGGIRWPEQHLPDGADIYAVNELDTEATPAALWEWLVRTDLWSSYYSNARFIRFLGGAGPRLGPGARWRWLTFGVLVTTTVEEFEPPHRLAWSGKGLGAEGYHAWLLESRPGEGTHILTEETQRGLGPRLLRPALRPAMLRFHQRWCEGLARKALEGSPPEPDSG